ncbi:MAG: hypothetical protein NW701_16330 [Nitrospira sp.]
MSSIEPQFVVCFLNAEHSSGGGFNLSEGRDRQGGTVMKRYQGGVATAQRKRPRPGGTCCSKMRSAKRGPQQVQVPSGRGVFERSTPPCLRAEALSRPGKFLYEVED